MFLRHVVDVDGITSNTYTLGEAIAMLRDWAPRIAAKASLVPAGSLLAASPVCDWLDPGETQHDRCSGAACSCPCHGLREHL